ncbi:hypothetical protein DFQ11_1161 [Winogradskyella epiphytica]|uniref:PD(D/E)XK endonuclease domain-containing protein n=1 Tax=Winogradskyella epiphytica TaxID=262005 RepID=A0A2V4WT37_9FLAO|nr:hypothetical protein [Winogradskyella epiphytica]PYE78801.1 hypothetical protein DFQ11_1161 [Winogradskyella epiphytica]GGW74815.1 hypothetical protein GCM10008085_28590 [Winogradskyella epiphytica]
MRANTFNTGIASEYLILSKLYRLELEAYITQGNKKSIDIRVIKENGETLSIDVKAVRGYSSLVVNNVEQKKNHFLVFVIYNNKFENLESHPDIYIVPSQKICEPLVSTFKKEKRVMKGKLAEYKDKWNLLTELNSEMEFNETAEQKIIADFNAVLQLRKINYNRERICEHLSINENELKELEIEYNRITGN